jgi:hypothetical protein
MIVSNAQQTNSADAKSRAADLRRFVLNNIHQLKGDRL